MFLCATIKGWKGDHSACLVCKAAKIQTRSVEDLSDRVVEVVFHNQTFDKPQAVLGVPLVRR